MLKHLKKQWSRFSDSVLSESHHGPLQSVETRLMFSADTAVVFDPDKLLEATDKIELATTIEEINTKLTKTAPPSEADKPDLLQPRQAISGITSEPAILISANSNQTELTGEDGSTESLTASELIAGDTISDEATGNSSAFLTNVLDLSSFTNGSVDLDAAHFVSNDITLGVGANAVDLQAGDLILSTATNRTFTGTDGGELSVNRDDLFIFRPTTAGDFSSGSFHELLTDLNSRTGLLEALGITLTGGDTVSAVSLIEQDVVIGGQTLTTGSLLVGFQQDSSVYVITPENFGTEDSLTLLTDLNIDGTSLPEDTGIASLEFIEQTVTFGSSQLTAGTLVVSFTGTGDFPNGGSNLTTATTDLISFSLSESGSDLVASVDSIIFEGGDINLTDSTINAFGFFTGTLDSQSENAPPIGEITIAGSTVEGETLSVDTSTLADADGLGTFNYQWLRNGEVIGNGRDATYELSQPDVGQQISVEITYTDGSGNEETIVSDVTSAVTNVNNTPQGNVNIIGTPTVGQTLVADISQLQDGDTLGTLNYQWLRDGNPITGANSNQYVVMNSDVGSELQLQVSYVDGQGTGESAASAASPLVSSPSTPDDTIVTSLMGSNIEDSTFSVNLDVTDSSTNPFTPTDTTYQWLRDGSAIDGATQSTYTADDADVGSRISVYIEFTNSSGETQNTVSSESEIITAINDSPTGTVSVTGNPTENETLLADTSAVSDADGLGAFSYQWFRDNTLIAGATDASFTLSQTDVGTNIHVQVSYTDQQGFDETLTSAPTAAITNINNPVTGDVFISGNAQEDETLSAVTASLTDTDGLGTLNYQWFRNGEAISGAVGEHYQLDDQDVNAIVSVEVNYMDANGSVERVFSENTDSITGVNDSPDGTINLVGTANVGERLSANTNQLSDPDGIGTLTYQWLRNGITIDNATESDYTITSLDENTALSVQISYLDNQGTLEAITSDSLLVNAIEEEPPATPPTDNTEPDTTVPDTTEPNPTEPDPTEQPINNEPPPEEDTPVVTPNNEEDQNPEQEEVATPEPNPIITPINDPTPVSTPSSAESEPVTAVDSNTGNDALESDTETANTDDNEGAEITAAVNSEEQSNSNDDNSNNTESDAIDTNTSDESPAEEATVTIGATTISRGSVADIDGIFDFQNLSTARLASFASVLGDSSSPISSFSELFNANALKTELTSFISYHEDNFLNIDSVLNSFDLLNYLNESEGDEPWTQEIHNLEIKSKIIWDGVATLTAGVSIGYTVWIIRSGFILSTALGALPAWRFVDPLPVLTGINTSQNDDDQSLEALVSDNANHQPSGGTHADKPMA
ncbi:beta strand repeat-containing protein [Sessilibacter corallicola]|uniref:beta strand repeat-containing protein n=1 Tax=Sessilibacter corallicola TaxID=2904075 RepID=UPI001E4482B2|nr:hypothetical protein [Sessilibacter corallicola]MCE2027840.1 hypothetical protein [Sessilibacter corallicola]